MDSRLKQRFARKIRGLNEGIYNYRQKEKEPKQLF
jgi:hypothetical protein